MEEALAFPHSEQAFTQSPDGHRALEVTSSLFSPWLCPGLDEELIPTEGR